MAGVNEVVAEMAEEAVEVASSVQALPGREIKFLLGGIGIGLICGGVTAYLLTERQLNKKYSELAEEEIDGMREHFQARLVANKKKPDLTETTNEYEDKVEPYRGNDGPNLGGQNAGTQDVSTGPAAHPVLEDADPAEKPDREVPERPDGAGLEPPQVTANVFDTAKEPSEGWDYEEEIRLRRPDRPYVIHIDERGEEGYNDTTFTYYEGDDVLTNEIEEVVDPNDRDKILGDDNLQKFGHGSGDIEVVFIRNDVLQLEIEISKHPGEYAHVVHGFVQHADDAISGRMHRRSRQFDDD